MIGAISIWLKSIIAVVILGSFMELILPDGKMQKYVAFAVGLVTLAAIAGPVLSAEGVLLPQITAPKTEYHINTEQIAAAMEEHIKARLPVQYVRVELNHSLEVTAVYVNNQVDGQAVADLLELPLEMVREDTNGKHST